MESILWLIPALPLAGFVTLILFGRRLGEPLAGILATFLTTASFVVGVVVFAGLLAEDEASRVFEQTLFRWIPAGDLAVDVGFLADPLSVTWVLFVTGVAALIHLYSIGYMHGDERFSQFFAYMNLFVFSMLVLVLADNLLLTFLGWEGVGLCSYLLISFWFDKRENASAGKKAFVTNRIGDWGFLVAMFLTFLTFGSLNYADVLPAAPAMATGTATVIGLLFLVGAVGKSAQVPLFVWLPDAMAGPTPVSALIHAATMVTAGVYLLVRINPILFAAHDELGLAIAWVGAVTAFVAATIAIAQNDIKRVLAYSTISQLGFMFLAVGVGAYVAAVFHVITHAFFKALLFLAAGSVIHGMDDEQDMRRMGGLRRLMPITHGTFVVGGLALAGIPPLAGFWSKDEVLIFGYDETLLLFVVGLAAALLTAVYMTRQYLMVFHGDPHWGADFREDDVPEAVGAGVAGGAAGAGGDAGEGPVQGDTETEAQVTTAIADPDFHPHESGWLMWFPLVVLAVLSVIGGVLNLPFSAEIKYLEHWLEPAIPFEVALDVSTGLKWGLAVLAGAIALAGVYLGYLGWGRRGLAGEERRTPGPALEPAFLANGWYIDWSFARFVAGPGTALFEAASWFDRTVIDGAVNGVGWISRGAGAGVRRVQGGLVRSYALLVAVGAVALGGYVLTRMQF